MLRLGELLSGACMYYRARTSLLYAGMMDWWHWCKASMCVVLATESCSDSKTGPGKLKMYVVKRLGVKPQHSSNRAYLPCT